VKIIKIKGECKIMYKDSAGAGYANDGLCNSNTLSLWKKQKNMNDQIWNAITVSIIPAGTKVTIDKDITGHVIMVKLCQNEILYDIGYFLNGEYKIVTLYEYEFECKEVIRKEVGFK
jgi:hypothetical protein